ncbi:Mg/Co/Ni transporter mgtE [Vibrio ishigakensis]|uniref:Mg/Co/Ni transporter mgtE n=1 Tax=Vibrio ishigakensis TaxID=1481914 RepID=A0A0B8Q7C5_9VIBR|nr:Mg/Co/Ni transporter mgtE [Vibrio ishigakensis]
MTVMNTTIAHDVNSFSREEICAATSAFLQYDEKQQLALLQKMPIEEAVGVLNQCSVAYVQKMISELELCGEDVRARHFAHQLGFIRSEAEPHKAIYQPAFWRMYNSVLAGLLVWPDGDRFGSYHCKL